MSEPPRALINVADLLARGFVDAADAAELQRVETAFRVRVTPAMQQVSPGIARQFVPSAAELTILPEQLSDPIGDAAHSPAPGLTHRYPDRVILHITQTCDVYCRFCFRREVVGAAGPLAQDDLAQSLCYIAATPEIGEVILTGGDPMTLSPRRLNDVMGKLDAIAHVGVIRFHTRVPVVAPERITALLPLLKRRAAVFVVVHTNHPDELTRQAKDASRALSDAGIPLMSQTVLLRGVNDDPDTLARLFRALNALRVVPYYLHHCDLARGTGHFRTSIARGLDIMAALRGHVSGLALPNYVLDLPGGYGKVMLESRNAELIGPALWRLTDWQGASHLYIDIDDT